MLSKDWIVTGRTTRLDLSWFAGLTLDQFIQMGSIHYCQLDQLSKEFITSEFIFGCQTFPELSSSQIVHVPHPVAKDTSLHKAFCKYISTYHSSILLRRNSEINFSEPLNFVSTDLHFVLMADS